MADHQPTAALVATIILKQDDRYLFLEEEQEGKRVLNFPAGHVEPGETPVEAARREAKEETGLDVKITGLAGIMQLTWKSGRHSVRFVFYAECIGGEEKPEAGSSLHWLTQAEVENRALGLDSGRALDEIFSWAVKGDRLDLSSMQMFDMRGGKKQVVKLDE